MNRHARRTTAVIAGALIAGVPAVLPAGPAAAEVPGETQLISVSSAGTRGDGNSSQGAISADGRYVAFTSAATNLVPGDTNGAGDVFVRDRQLGLTTRVSVSSTGQQGNQDSLSPSISADGRYVAFFSYASNLVSGDTNGAGDAFVHDRQTGTTVRVNVSSTGAQANAGGGGHPRISADGSAVIFRSAASNLVPGDTNGVVDIFVHHLPTGQTSRVSVSSTGEQADGDSSFSPGSLSDDGRYATFISSAGNLVADDTNGTADVFVHDRQTGQTTRANLTSTGAQATYAATGSPIISADGRYVLVTTPASLVPEVPPPPGGITCPDCVARAYVYVRDRVAATTTLVSVTSTGELPDGNSGGVGLSADARYVAFSSQATNLDPDAPKGPWGEAFRHDRQTGRTDQASVAAPGQWSSTGLRGAAAISADGQHVVVTSGPRGFIPDDPDHPLREVFVRSPIGAYPPGNPPLPPPPPPVGGCTVSHQTTAWPGGAIVHLVVTNNVADWHGWQLTFAAPGLTLSSAWGAVWSQSGNRFTAANQPWNGTVGTGRSVHLGLSGHTTGGAPALAGFAVNGVPCTTP